MGAIRLLQVSSHGADAGVGGVGKHLMRHGLLLPARGFDVRFLCAFPEAVPPPGPTIVLYQAHWRHSQIRRIANHALDAASVVRPVLRRAIAWARPDIVHTHSLPGITTAIWEVCRQANVPVVHTAHDYQLLCPRVTLMRPDGQTCRPHPLLCGLRRGSMTRWAGAVSLLLAPTAHVLRRHEGIFPSTTVQAVAPNPWDSQFLRVRSRSPVQRLRVLGYIGRLDHTKGLRPLLAALPELTSLGLAVHIAGTGRMQSEIESAAHRWTNLVYHGLVRGTEKDEFLAGCDVGLVPSLWEEPAGPVNAMMEWLAAGRPVLTSDRGGLAEALIEQPGAIALEPTRDGIVAAVRGLLEPSAWEEARKRAQQPPRGMDEQQWADLHADFFRSVLARQRSSEVAE